jgi:hypothetical protein
VSGLVAVRRRNIVVPSTALLHLNGTNGSTSFPDVYGSTWTTAGSPVISTAQQQFGPGSLLLDGSSLLTTSHDIFAPGSADWTYEAFVNASNLSGSRVVFGSQGAGFSGVLLFCNAGALTLLCGDSVGGSWGVATGGTSLSTGTWYHVAAVRHGNNFAGYVAGATALTATYSGAIIKGMTGQAIGSANGSPNSPWVGNIEQARISMGIARYTAPFTPPAGPFTY